MNFSRRFLRARFSAALSFLLRFATVDGVHSIPERAWERKTPNAVLLGVFVFLATAAWPEAMKTSRSGSEACSLGANNVAFSYTKRHFDGIW